MKLGFDWRYPVLAVQFLTRLPTPTIRDFEPRLLAGAVGWFPAVGLLLGALLLGLAALLQSETQLAAALILLAWVWLTGALHLDGLADMADGLGAAHRDPARFLAVLKDPHLGSFGVVTLILQLLVKWVALTWLVSHSALWALLLIPAWARSGVFTWQTLPALAPGMAEQFAWAQRPWLARLWWLSLLGLSAWLAPALLLAPLLIWLYRYWLLQRLGGVTGDCLGAGIELLETGLLLALPLLSLLGKLALN
ncbi:adenosylcobinamide-GDP ribazoletransferase [Chitinibacter tainanensis]|uniref:adenosylcobinamide-GDP ribazoletransferase n=1 Tax=Chitinibacter tainanensis TaxID=230667 RepID=UPI00041823B4|nr:adenosylcobinamide-GDP ribazoletransferase [Chitinibacter tainanensis]